MSTYDQGANLVLTFTSSNVRAVGGDFFLTDLNENWTTGSFTITLNDGSFENVSLAAGDAGTAKFVGFMSDSANITSLTFSGVSAGGYATLDNLYVGTPVPEASTWLGAAFIGGVLSLRVGRKILAQRSK
jgi:hypothetical protein